MIVVVMGVAGCGKTRVGRALADALGWSFYDADDFHLPESVARMRDGIALTDADRAPWLERLRTLLLRVDANGDHAVLACSALRRSFRASLRNGLRDVRYVHLQAHRDVVAKRLQERQGHFMPPTLLDSQLETLEHPDDALTVDASQSPEAIVEEIRRSLHV